MNSSAVLVQEALHFLIFLSVRLRVPQWFRLGQLGGPSLCPAGLCSFASLRRLEAWCVSHCPCAELSRAGPSSVSALLSTPTPPSTSAPHDYAEVSSPGDRPLVTMWGHLAQGAPMTMWGCLAPGSPPVLLRLCGSPGPAPPVWLRKEVSEGRLLAGFHCSPPGGSYVSSGDGRRAVMRSRWHKESL